MSASASIYSLEVKSGAAEINAYDLASLDLTKLLREVASIIILEQLEPILVCKQTTPIEKSQAIQQCISQWWRCVQHTDMNYMHASQHPVNIMLLHIANGLAVQLNVLHLSLLMPTISFTPALTAVTGTDLDQLKVTNIVLDDKGESIIEVSACLLWLDANLERFSIEQLSSDNRDRLCHTVITNLTHQPLSNSEAKRVINHSKEAKQFYEAMTRMLEYRKCPNSLGGKIDYLITQLRKGGQSAGRGGTGSFAGPDAVDGIGAFNKYLASMPESIRNKLFALRAANGSTLTFGERWTPLITGADVCVEQTAEAFQAILTKFPNLYDPNPFGTEAAELKEMKAQQDSLGIDLRAKWQQAKQDFQAVFDTDKYCVTASYGKKSNKRLAENLFTNYFLLLIARIDTYPHLCAMLGNLNSALAKQLLHSIPAAKLRSMTPTLRDMAALVNFLTEGDEEPEPEDVALFIADENWLKKALQNADDLHIALQYTDIGTQILTSENLTSLMQRKSQLDFFVDVLPEAPKAGFFEYLMGDRINDWIKIIISRPNACAAFKAIYDQFETDQERLAFLAHFDAEWYYQRILAFDFNEIRSNLRHLLLCSLLDEHVIKTIFDRLSVKCWNEILNDRDTFRFIARFIRDNAHLAFLAANFSPKLQQLLIENNDIFLDKYVDPCPREQVLHFLDQHDPMWIKQTIKTLDDFLTLFSKIPADQLEKYQAYFPDMNLIRLDDVRSVRAITPWLEHLCKRHLVSNHLFSFYKKSAWLKKEILENPQLMILVLDCLPDDQKYPFCRDVLALRKSGKPTLMPKRFLFLLNSLNSVDRRKFIKVLGGFANIKAYKEDGFEHLNLLGTEQHDKRQLQIGRDCLDQELLVSLKWTDKYGEIKGLPQECVQQCLSIERNYRNQLLQCINTATSIINTALLDQPAGQLLSQLSSTSEQLHKSGTALQSLKSSVHWVNTSRAMIDKHFNHQLNTVELLALFREEERQAFFWKWLREGYLDITAIVLNPNQLFALLPKDKHDEIFFSRPYMYEITRRIGWLNFPENEQKKTQEIIDTALPLLPLNRRLEFINQLLIYTSSTPCYYNNSIFARICIHSLLKTCPAPDPSLITLGSDVLRAADEWIAAFPSKSEDINTVSDFQIKTIKVMLAPDNLAYRDAYTKAFDRLPPNAAKLRGKAEIFGGLLTLVAAIPLVPYCAAAAFITLALGIIVAACGMTRLFSNANNPITARLYYHSQWFFNSLRNHHSEERPELLRQRPSGQRLSS